MGYTPGAGVIDANVASELLQVSRAIQELENRIITKVHAEPEKPRLGMMVYADGSDWNPGEGQGLYYYDGSWVFTGVGANEALAYFLDY